MDPYVPYYMSKEECEAKCNKTKDCTAFTGMFMEKMIRFRDGTLSNDVCFMAYRNQYKGKTEGSDPRAECWIKKGDALKEQDYEDQS